MSDPSPSPPSTAPDPPVDADAFPTTGPGALGSFGARAIARIIDEAIISAPFALAIYAIAGDEGSTNTGWALVALLVAIVVQGIYEIGAVAVWGRTLGKLALGLCVVRMDDGGRPTWAQAALRGMLPLVADAAVAALAIDFWGGAVVYASSFLNPLRRGWHDLAGGTIVVRTR